MLRLPRLLRSLRSNPERQRGQALPLFVLMIFVLTGSVAIVTDVSWFWVNSQRMQRAADAASLAGAVFLPGDVPSALAAARSSAAQNGYPTAGYPAGNPGATGVTVTPSQDPTNHRRLLVTVSGPVNTFFARVFGMNTIQESATSKAEFTLPVPMGSPQAWYGVGGFQKQVSTSNTTTATATTDSGWRTGIASVGTWSTPANANATNDNIFAISTTTSGSAQEWKTFNISGQLPTLSANQRLTVTGLELALTHDLTGGSGGSTINCKLVADLSWDGGVTYNATASQPITPLPLPETATTLGTAASYASWGTHVWTAADFTNFRVRLTFSKPNCDAARTVSIDTLQVRASWSVATDTTTVTTATNTVPIKDPNGGAIAPQGFWGAIITSGGSRENGDEFSPKNDNGGYPGHTSTNPENDNAGYDYTVIVGAGGKVEIFDPSFCETGSPPAPSAGNYGAGDHWIGTVAPVTTVFTLWDTTGALGQEATSGALFANQKQSDQGGTMGSPSHTSPAVADCSADPYHNAWWVLKSGLPAGKYRLNVNTSTPSNDATSAENMWSLWVDGGGAAQVYGKGRMAAYNNLPAGVQQFYLAQIGPENAGKTMEISLFDPGDVNGAASLRIKSPNGSVYNYANFTYSADNGKDSGASGTTLVNVIPTAVASGTCQTNPGTNSCFQDSVITIDIALPTNYGSGGLTPSGETQAGWWKIEYTVAGGNDTTTWQVAIKGSPVHLVP